ncbi:hypothetical protein EDB80DRAFT_885967 [Ilyonectria destructans]|nr:hypothetical protein EDB80DRAFT_885967 [Ilyonectria destructans]
MYLAQTRHKARTCSFRNGSPHLPQAPQPAVCRVRKCACACIMAVLLAVMLTVPVLGLRPQGLHDFHAPQDPSRVDTLEGFQDRGLFIHLPAVDRRR